MFECTVTEATYGDLPAMASLLASLFSQEHEFEPDAARQTAALDAILAQSSVGQLFVARGKDVRVVGMVSLLFTVSTACGGRAAWLEDLVVSPAMRGQGLGTRLLEHAIGWARRNDIRRITLLTDGDNEDAQSLYLRHGFTTSRMIPLRLHM